MAEYDELTDGALIPVYANATNNIEAPTTGKNATGIELNEVPASKIYNNLFNKLGRAVNFLLRRSLTKYVSGQTYKVGDYVIGTDGVVYQAITAGNNGAPAWDNPAWLWNATHPMGVPLLWHWSNDVSGTCPTGWKSFAAANYGTAKNPPSYIDARHGTDKKVPNLDGRFLMGVGTQGGNTYLQTNDKYKSGNMLEQKLLKHQHKMPHIHDSGTFAASAHTHDTTIDITNHRHYLSYIGATGYWQLLTRAGGVHADPSGKGILFDPATANRVHSLRIDDLGGDGIDIFDLATAEAIGTGITSVNDSNKLFTGTSTAKGSKVVGATGSTEELTVAVGDDATIPTTTTINYIYRITNI